MRESETECVSSQFFSVWSDFGRLCGSLQMSPLPKMTRACQQGSGGNVKNEDLQVILSRGFV